MKRFLYAISSMLLAQGFVLNVQAASNVQAAKSFPKNYYLRGDIGESFPEDVFKHRSGYTHYVKKKPNSSLLYSVGAGYYFNNNIRVDLILSRYDNFKYSAISLNSRKQNTLIKQNISSDTAMLNAYYDIDLIKNSGFTPYIGIGFGGSRTKVGDLVYSRYDVALATFEVNKKYKIKPSVGIMAGISYKSNNNLSFDLGYKYTYLGRWKFDLDTAPRIEIYKKAPKQHHASSQSLYVHNITAGMRYSF
jgi:opacity protein-like surface antigen